MLTKLTIAGALCALILAVGCREKTGENHPAETIDPTRVKHVLRTYELPAGQEDAVKRLLKGNLYPISVVSASGAQTQFVHLNPQFTGQGHFVLSAPEGIHAGVREVLDVIAKSKPGGGPSSVQVTYWVVLGYPAKEARVDPSLSEVDVPLQEIAKIRSMHFRLLDKLSLTAINGENGSVRSHVAIDQEASMTKASIELKLKINAETSEIKTTVRLQPGQFAVLGQAGYQPKQSIFEPKEGEGQPTVFYLARAEALK